MRVAKRLLILSVLVFLCSCGQKGAAFSIETFKEVPKEINAGSFFAETGADLDKGNYLFVQDYDSTAFVLVNGKTIKAKLTKCIIDSVANTLNEEYQQSGYKIRLNAKYVNDDGNKDYDFEGRLTVENKAGDTITMNVFGYDLVE